MNWIKKIQLLYIYQNKIQKIFVNNENNSNIFLYSNEFKNEQLNKLEAEVYYITSFIRNQI